MRAVTLALLFWCVSAYAGDERGNGGDGIRCKYNSKYSVELLDHYEARTVRGLEINLGEPTLDPKEKVQIAIGRIQNINPIRAKRYFTWLEDFYKEAYFVTDGELQDIPDAGAVVIPTGCQLVQLGVFQEKTLPGDRMYIINKKYWDELNSDGKAGLILHELIYRDLTTQFMPHANSKMARYFNGLMSAHNLNAYTLKAYIDLMQTLRVATAEAQYGVPIKLFNCEDQCTPIFPRWFDETKIREAVNHDDLFNYKFWNADLRVMGAHKEFNEDGWLKSFFVMNELNIQLDENARIYWRSDGTPSGHAVRIEYFANQYISFDRAWTKVNFELITSGNKENCERVIYNIQKQKAQCYKGN